MRAEPTMPPTEIGSTLMVVRILSPYQLTQEQFDDLLYCYRINPGTDAEFRVICENVRHRQVFCMRDRVMTHEYTLYLRTV